MYSCFMHAKLVSKLTATEEFVSPIRTIHLNTITYKHGGNTGSKKCATGNILSWTAKS